MLRLSSTYSSICFLVFIHFIWLLLLTKATAKPANGPIMSFTNQTRSEQSQKEFDFARNEAEATTSVHLRHLFNGLLLLPPPSITVDLNNSLETDDESVTSVNTLGDELMLDLASTTETPDSLNRVKLAIPVLESVRHLINTVGEGGVNDTHVRNNHHRLLGHSGVHHAPHHSSVNASAAIETEEDRETAIDSTGFNVLETLGATGTVLLGFLQNIRKLFAASASNASSASSGGGFGQAGGK